MSKPGDTWMPLWIGDYLADTMHLQAAEHGAYLLLLMHSWRNGPLPNDDKILSGIARISLKVWTKEIGATVRAFFVIGDDGLLHQKRLDRERERVSDISDKRRTAAGKRHANKPTNDPQPPPQNGSKPDANAGANAGANAHANGLQTPMQNASISPSPSEEVAKPLSSEGSHAPAREAVPLMPSLGDPLHRWSHLGEKSEVDEDMKTHPVVGGYYLDVICAAVCEAAGINDANFRGDWRPIIAWLKDGLDPDDQILPAIRTVAARPSFRPHEIRNFGYFDQAVRQYRRVA